MHDWLEKRQKPAEQQIQRAVYAYLRDARKRYVERVEAYITQRKTSGSNHVIKAVTDWQQLIGFADEVFKLQRSLGRSWESVWTLSGTDALDDVYAMAGKTKPLDLVFGSRTAAVQAIDNASMNIAQTTANNIKKIVENGLLNGDSVDEIASTIKSDASFGIKRSRTIARTESTKAVNMATDQAYQTAAANGINIRKQWLSSDDEKVRPTHQDLDGQTVGVNEDFVIVSTGKTAPSPAAFGEASEDINCRCTIVAVIED